MDDKGQSLQSSRNQSDNTVRVVVPGRLAQRVSRLSLTFNYDGRLTGNEDSPIYGIKFAAIQPDYAFLLYPARWFPVSGYTTDRFTAKINVTVPQGYTVIGSGIDSKPVERRRHHVQLRFHQAVFPRRHRRREGPAGQELHRRLDHDALVPRRRSEHGQRLWRGDRADDGILHRHLRSCALRQHDSDRNRRRIAQRICRAGH